MKKLSKTTLEMIYCQLIFSKLEIEYDDDLEDNEPLSVIRDRYRTDNTSNDSQSTYTRVQGF